MDEKKKARSLFDWQKRAIDYFFSSDHYKKSGEAIFQAGTGVGKTVLGIEIIKEIWKRDNPDLKVLIVVPKNVILEDTWYPELYNNGISILDIGVYYGNIKETSKITITNTHNLELIDLNEFDILVIDELHNCGTTRIMGLLKSRRFDFDYKLGLTATLKRSDNGHYKILNYFDWAKFDYMPDQALKDGILNPFDFINISIEMDKDTYSEYTDITGQINVLIGQLGPGFMRIPLSNPLKPKLMAMFNQRKDLTANYYRKFDIVWDIIKKNPNSKILVFNEYNKQTTAMYWFLLEKGIKGGIVHSGIPKNKVTQTLMDFKQDRLNLILTTRVLDEGVNIPKCDVAIICAGQSNSRQTIQRMGRVLRKKFKKSKLYQLFIKSTVEEKHSHKRAELFKELCEDYKEYSYDLISK